MNKSLKILLTGTASALLAATAISAHSHDGDNMPHTAQSAMTAALNSPIRTRDVPRDQYRHPAETLEFFQVKPGMTVMDIIPSGGWYTRILVPYLGEEGQYIGLNPDVTNGPDRLKGMDGLANSFPAAAAKMTQVAPERILAFNSNSIAPDVVGTVDRALIFREIHNLYRFGLLDAELKTLHNVLKDDGMLGIVQHRANDGAPDAAANGNLGYLREADVIKWVEAQGFELVAKSEINANPKDTKDYEGGVWTLPPSFGTGDANREIYAAIGESDRMTLLFKKRS